MRKVAQVSMQMMPAQGRIPTFDIGDRLRKAREVADVSQEDMAEQIGVSRRSIVRYERGGAVPKSALLLYSLRTGVPIEWLKDGEAPPTGDGGGAAVHPLGLEPRTHWLIDSARPVRHLRPAAVAA
jgi:transcriptional regulator with XRE-family HTH domain